MLVFPLRVILRLVVRLVVRLVMRLMMRLVVRLVVRMVVIVVRMGMIMVVRIEPIPTQFALIIKFCLLIALYP